DGQQADGDHELDEGETPTGLHGRPRLEESGAVSASPRRVAIGVLMAGVKLWANGRSNARNCRRTRKSAIRPLVFSPSAQRARLPEPLPAHAALHADHQLAVTVQRGPVADGEGAVADVAHASA